MDINPDPNQMFFYCKIVQFVIFLLAYYFIVVYSMTKFKIGLYELVKIKFRFSSYFLISDTLWRSKCFYLMRSLLFEGY